MGERLTSMNRQEPAETAPSLGQAAFPLVASDAVLQGARYAFLLYLGDRSLSDLGAFLMGAAAGSLLGVIADFGISQHWLRSALSQAPLTRRTFLAVMLGKGLWSCLGSLALGFLILGGVWKVTAPLAMGIGLLLMVLQALGDSCEAAGLLLRRYRTVVLFRIVFSVGLYLLPLACGVLLSGGYESGGTLLPLGLAGAGGVLLTSLYMMNVADVLPHDTKRSVRYTEAWWAARWLGFNQVAVVVDVRAPLIILGLMLGEAAVGLYGLVQRTTAVVELAWASISRLLLTSYSELIGGQGAATMRLRVVQAGRVTASLMMALMLAVWGAGLLFTRTTSLSSDTAVALSLLQWAVVAIGFSSIKRPFVSGLMALFQERLVCRVNVTAALLGLVLVPLGILYWGIWGPVITWIVLEAAACLVLVWWFLRISDEAPPDITASGEPK